MKRVILNLFFALILLILFVIAYGELGGDLFFISNDPYPCVTETPCVRLDVHATRTSANIFFNLFLFYIVFYIISGLILDIFSKSSPIKTKVIKFILIFIAFFIGLFIAKTLLYFEMYIPGSFIF